MLRQGRGRPWEGAETWAIDQQGRSGPFLQYLFPPKIEQTNKQTKLAPSCALAFCLLRSVESSPPKSSAVSSEMCQVDCPSPSPSCGRKPAVQSQALWGERRFPSNSQPAFAVPGVQLDSPAQVSGCLVTAQNHPPGALPLGPDRIRGLGGLWKCSAAFLRVRSAFSPLLLSLHRLVVCVFTPWPRRCFCGPLLTRGRGGRGAAFWQTPECWASCSSLCAVSVQKAHHRSAFRR